MEIRRVADTIKGFEASFRISEETGASLKDIPKVLQEAQGKSSEGGEGESLSEAQVSQWVEKINTVMEALAIEARFSIHEPTHTVMVTLVNRETGEVIRQIPPEKFLDMVARLRELAGLFVDEVV